MPGDSRFNAEALEHHRRSDGLGPVFGDAPAVTRPRGAAERITAVRERFGRRTRGARLQVCFQTQVSDCGPAALVTVLRHHGVDVSLDEIRARAGSGRNGASARTLLEIAREYGVKGRGVRARAEALARLSPGSILFWNFNHFVVLEGAGKDHVDVIDPVHGRRRLTLATVAESGLPAPEFHDTGLSFTAILRSAEPLGLRPSIGRAESTGTVQATTADRIASLKAGGTHRSVWDALAQGPLTVTQLSEVTGRTPANVRKSLRLLRGMSLVMLEGGRGRTTIYRRVGG